MKILSITKNGETVDPKTTGLGDIVERLAKPIAKALHLPCLDKTGNLRPESGCAKRKKLMNNIRLPHPPHSIP